jgi:hypothetical protein
MAKKNIFENLDLKKIGGYLAIGVAAVGAIVNEVSAQKEKAEFEKLKKTVEFLAKGKES